MKKAAILSFFVLNFLLLSGAVWNANNLSELQTALSTAESNGEEDTIYLPAGIFTFGAEENTVEQTLSYQAIPSENYSLSLVGSDSATTIIDAENQLQILFLGFEACTGSIVNISNIQFLNGKGEIDVNDNNPSHNGGGLHLAGGDEISILLENCTFENCSAPWGGGASVFIGSESNCEINSCNFSENTATYSIDDYAAGGDGGGLYCGVGESSSLRIQNSNFENNMTLIGEPSADDAGGVMIYSESPNSSVELLDNVFTGNNGSDGGGVMIYFLADSADCTIQNNLFEDNIARDNGGGLWLRATQGIDFIHSNNTYTDNQCNFYGGGEYWEIEVAANVETYENVYRNNIADGPWDDSQGGACYIECPVDSIEIHHNQYFGNYSDSHGGAISLNCGDLALIHHNIASENSCTGIGGFLNLSIALADGNAQIYHNTTYMNSSDMGSSIFCDAWETDYSIQITNNIFWGESSDAIHYATWNPSFDPSDIEITYCDINDDSEAGIIYGAGCINADPIFDNPEQDNFHITWQNFPEEDVTTDVPAQY